MQKRFQIFVSSTYADLKEERQKVIQTLMEMDCIPAGMELFPAADEEQFEFIKRIIDDCDYYLLIIGGRYGSLTSEGISYTEKEYEYAVSIGLKVLAFVHEKPEEIPVGKSEIDQALREKLDDFRTKVSDSRLVKFWSHATELPGLVSLSLSKTIKLYPAIGWVRANNIASEDLLVDVNTMRKENDALKLKLKNLQSVEPPPELNLASMDEFYEIRVSWSGTYAGSETFKVSWSTLFSIIAPSLMEHPFDQKVSSILAEGMYKKERKDSSIPFHIEVEKEDFETVRVQLSTYGLINVEYKKATQGEMALFWSLTPKGEQLMLQLRTIKATEN
ncbi:DUF4062 domain-containing protein [Gimesia aquarii]|uniref:DUF4062 domain-containing protein n=1 Tax=Gimesia aquarii TaxID=2527964 RepID=A0A517WSF6_9PLAN|nr:DUF4062 domain-containing protein [Gimesia aquarii]QDU08158.1 hypothetical protein V202x_15220 [Gimesia aquarii]